MNSNANSNSASSSALSIKEMVGFVIIVGSTLYLLYPKNDIEELVTENKEKNTQLSIDYLKGMLTHNPNDVELKHKLIEKYHTNGELNKSLELTQELITKTKDSNELKKILQNEYKLLKEQYFKEKDENGTALLIEVKNRLENLFQHAKDRDDYTFLLQESTSMDFRELRNKAFTYLLKEKNVSQKIKEDAVDFFINTDKLDKAEPLVIDLLEREESQEKRLKYFKTAFYILAQNKMQNREKIKKVINTYKEKSSLTKSDIHLLSNRYLQINEKQEAADFIYSSFQNHKELFDEENIDEAIQVLSYNSQLKEALELSNYAYNQYPSQKNLDNVIQFSTWLSLSDKVIELNNEGWERYKDNKYKKYLLEKTTFNNAYKIRGKLYKQSIENGDFSMVKKLGDYYEYTGEIAKAEEYFSYLVKKYPIKSIYKELIRFSHDNCSFSKVDKLYSEYRKKFGIDGEIHKKLIEEYIATKQLDRAYKFSKELEALGETKDKPHNTKSTHSGHHHGHLEPPKTDYDSILKQLAWIDQDYNYAHSLLWRKEKKFTKKHNSYARLIKLESKLSKKPKLEYLYKKAWETTKDRSYLPLLLSYYLDKKEYKKFHKILLSLKQKDRDTLEKHTYFHILLANYYQGIDNENLALVSFEKALKLEPENSNIRQMYLWFLLNTDNYTKLESELNLLKKDKKLQQSIAFPSVVTALKLDKSDLAYQWLQPLLKEDKSKVEYQALYADILDFQGETDRAKTIRSKVFKTMHKQLKSSKELLNDKDFAQLYLQMALYYKFSNSKKEHYLEKFKSLFSEKEYRDIKLSFYSSQNILNKIDELVSNEKANYPWLNLYLATQRGDKEFAKKAYSTNDYRFSLKENVSIAIDSDHKDDAYTQIFKGMQENKNSINLITSYWRLVNAEFPKSKLSIKSEHLSRNTTLNNMEFSTKYALNSHIDIGIKFLQNNFIREHKKSFTEESVGLFVGNHDSDFLWYLGLEKFFGEYSYNNLQFMLHYNLKNAFIELNLKKNNKTILTPKLETYGLENSASLNFMYDINKQNIIGATYSHNEYHLKNGGFLGKGDIIQLSSTHLMRLGYPDITLFNHLNIENFDFKNRDMGLSSFSEIGSEITIGANAKNKLHKSWKPYMSLGIAMNDHKQIGSSLTIGTAGMAYQADKLDISLRYIKGINNLNEELYGAYLNYSF